MGSHALRAVLDAAQLHSLETAVQYQLVNGLGLLAIGLLLRARQDEWLPRIAWLLLAGVVCFSGGIYIMLAGAPRLLGLVTPLGRCDDEMGAWALLAWRLHRISASPAI